MGGSPPHEHLDATRPVMEALKAPLRHAAGFDFACRDPSIAHRHGLQAQRKGFIGPSHRHSAHHRRSPHASGDACFRAEHFRVGAIHGTLPFGSMALHSNERPFIELNCMFSQVFLNRPHSILKPNTYLEIGALNGNTLKIAECAAISTDPAFQISSDVPGRHDRRCGRNGAAPVLRVPESVRLPAT